VSGTDRDTRPALTADGAMSAGWADRILCGEGPVVTAEPESLWVDDHPVTNAAFRRFVTDTGHVTIAETAPG
jgi:formylglycine-generating enzyme required for sulfatase activity